MGNTDVKPVLFVPFGGEGGEGGAAQMGDWGWPAKWGKRPAAQTGHGLRAFTAVLIPGKKWTFFASPNR